MSDEPMCPCGKPERWHVDGYEMHRACVAAAVRAEQYPGFGRELIKALRRDAK